MVIEFCEHELGEIYELREMIGYNANIEKNYDLEDLMMVADPKTIIKYAIRKRLEYEEYKHEDLVKEYEKKTMSFAEMLDEKEEQ